MYRNWETEGDRFERVGELLILEWTLKKLSGLEWNGVCLVQG
jgi:hypothetical protein